MTKSAQYELCQLKEEHFMPKRSQKTYTDQLIKRQKSRGSYGLSTWLRIGQKERSSDMYLESSIKVENEYFKKLEIMSRKSNSIKKQSKLESESRQQPLEVEVKASKPSILEDFGHWLRKIDFYAYK
jgi:hypothetical protein